MGDHLLKRKNLTFNRNENKEIIGSAITIHKSKTNQFGEEKDQIGQNCKCPQPCGPHFLYNYLHKRARKFGKIKPNDPLLLDDRGKTLKAELVTNAIRNIIYQLDLNPLHYNTHSLRIGAATDLARDNVQHFIIKQWGRWRSNCWETTYARLDYLDLAKLTNTTLSSWTQKPN